MNKQLALAGAILLAILLMCFSIPAEAKEIISIDEEGYYSCEYYQGDVLVYKVTKGICIDHQSVLSDNNVVMNDGEKMINHFEFNGDLEAPRLNPVYTRIREENKVKHNARLVKNSIMRQIRELEELIK